MINKDTTAAVTVLRLIDKITKQDISADKKVYVLKYLQSELWNWKDQILAVGVDAIITTTINDLTA